jgi:predicted metal-dependent hydrolase
VRDAAARHEVGRLNKPDFVSYFRAGLDHFNAAEFWDAHESWETIWLEAESDLHRFLQGLIQLAAAYHHVKRGTYPGGLRLFDAALEKLSAFPKRWCGIDRTSAEEAARRHRDWVATLLVQGATDKRLDPADFPQIALDDSPMPPFEHW